MTVARSVARLTAARSTPGVFVRNRSMRFTHEAQVIPSMGRTISIAWFCILPGSIHVATYAGTIPTGPAPVQSTAYRSRWKDSYIVDASPTAAR